jgi:hypothetical protein
VGIEIGVSDGCVGKHRWFFIANETIAAVDLTEEILSFVCEEPPCVFDQTVGVLADKQYRRILRAGRQSNPLSPEQLAKTRPKQSKEQNLLDRLEECEDCILAFLWNWDLPFTNNQAERDFRILKARLKISGCFRTLAGARRHVRIRSYISTLRKHGLPVLEHLRLALDGHPFLPALSRTT